MENKHELAEYLEKYLGGNKKHNYVLLVQFEKKIELGKKMVLIDKNE